MGTMTPFTPDVGADGRGRTTQEGQEGTGVT
jgi:hypothetical protein